MTAPFAPDDAATSGRGARAAGWVCASAGAVLWVLLIQAAQGFAGSRNRGWLGNAKGLETAAPWLALLLAAMAAVVVLTVVAARPRASWRAAVAGLVAAAVELVAAIVVVSWDYPESGLGILGFMFALWMAIVHAFASVAGFGGAWIDRLPPRRTADEVIPPAA